MIRVPVVELRLQHLPPPAPEHAQRDQLYREYRDELEAFNFGVHAAGEERDGVVRDILDYVRGEDQLRRGQP